MLIAIHCMGLGRTLRFEASAKEILLTPRTALCAAARAVHIFAVYFRIRSDRLKYTKICTIRNFAPFENFPLYGTGQNIAVAHSVHKYSSNGTVLAIMIQLTTVYN